MSKDKILIIKNLNNEILDKAYEDVKKDNIYNDENELIERVLLNNPLNNDVDNVAMKIALIDVTNSTHLSQYKKDINLYKLAEIIASKDLRFDERVRIGDESLIVDIAKNNGSKNLFSFASKYCFYHNALVYKKDDYAKFDEIVKGCLPLYAQKYNVTYKNKKITNNILETLRKSVDYSAFNSIVKQVLKDITTSNKVGKFDAVMWYYNRSGYKSNKK